MADNASEIEWYLARDGQQHGPLSENEMRAFVDLGHLRLTDLIWRAGFTEWRPAPEVFAIHTQPHPPVPQAIAEPVAVAPVDGHAAIAHAAALSVEPGPQSQPHVAAPSNDDLRSPGQLHAPAAYTAASANNHPQPAVDPAAPQFNPQPIIRPHALDQQSQIQPTTPSPRARKPARDQQRAPVPIQHDDFGPDDEEEESRRLTKRRFGLARIAAALFLAVLVGAIIIAITKRDMVTSLLPTGLASASLSTSAPRTAPFAASGGSAEAVDANFQRAPIWRHIKQEFPEWYTERVQEAAKFAAEKRGDGAIAKHLAEAVVALRRKHADQALTASPERLRFVATAFVDNLQTLAKQNVETCYGFISQGETYPPILEMLQKPEGHEGLQKQVIAIFDAISDGRKAPQSYLPPRKADYDALAAELNTLGWSEDDLRTFSDPRALGRASPQQVCRMVQDWFAAQIAIKDPASQLRLLVESLRPVVAG